MIFFVGKKSYNYSYKHYEICYDKHPIANFLFEYIS